MKPYFNKLSYPAFASSIFSEVIILDVTKISSSFNNLPDAGVNYVTYLKSYITLVDTKVRPLIIFVKRRF